MKKRLFEKKIAVRTRTWFFIAFALLLIGNISSYISTEKIKQQARYVQRTNMIIDGLENTLSFVVRAESSFRGFLIDEDDFHKGILQRSILRTDSSIDNVISLSDVGPSPNSDIARLGPQIRVITETIRQDFDDYTSGKTSRDQVVSKAEGIHQDIRNLEKNVRGIQDQEQTVALDFSRNTARYINNIKFLSIISTFVAILLTLYSILVYNKENRAKKEADHNAERYKEKLKSQVETLEGMNNELMNLRGLEKYTATGRIARTIAHEVRNPLTNINLAVEQLKTEFEGTEDADTFLEMINRNSARINKLVSDLLNATKTAELIKKPTSINQLMDECLDEAGDRIRLKHINVIKHYNTPICTVSVDADKMKIAMINFIVNGIEAMDKGGTLTVSTEKGTNGCIVRISDTGVGMSKDQLERLFEPFFSTKKNGNGLGLANSHNIIVSHNGNVSAQSKEGEGTMFTITLGQNN